MPVVCVRGGVRSVSGDEAPESLLGGGSGARPRTLCLAAAPADS